MFKRFSAGFAVGYVMGARAGQKRYDQITDLAEKALAVPGVDRFTERASDLLTADNGRRLLGTVVDRARSGLSSNHQDSNEDSDDAEDADGYDGSEDYDDSEGDSGRDEEDDDSGELDEDQPDDEGDEDAYDEDEYDENEPDEDEGDEDESGDQDDVAARHRNGSKSTRSSRRPGRPHRSSPARTKVKSGGRNGDHGGRIRGLASAAIERGKVD